ncbi:MAG: oligosaccharide flippase family protein [Candidatus Zixiibacteriota bacterium]
MGFWRQLIRNATAFWGSLAVRTVVAFFFTPFIAASLGSAVYGLWVVIFQTITYCTLFDFGLEKALTRFIGWSESVSDYRETNRILNSAFILYGTAGFLVLVVTPILVQLVIRSIAMSVPGAGEQPVYAFYIIGAYLAVRFWLTPFAGSLGGFQRFDIANGLEIGEELIRTLLMVAALIAGFGLVALASIIFGASLIRQVAAIVWLRRIRPHTRLDLHLADRRTARNLVDYSAIAFGISIAWLVIFNTDSILLGLLLGPAAAGVYAPGAQMMLYLRQIVNAVGNPLMPAISQLEGRRQDEKIRQVYFRISGYMTFAAVFACAGVVLYAHPFVRLWLPQEFAASGSVMVVLAAGSAFYLPHIIGNAMLFGLGRHKFLFYTLAFEGSLKLALSFVLIPRYGVTGMALAAAVPQVVTYVAFFPWMMSRQLAFPLRHLAVSMIRSGSLALLVSVPTALILRYLLGVQNWFDFGLNVGVVTAVALVAAWYVLIDKPDRERLTAYLRGAFPRS